MSAPKLRRCPACGKRGCLLVGLWPAGGDGFRVVCSGRVDGGSSLCGGCGLCGPATSTEADAIAAWNALPRRPKRRNAVGVVNALVDAAYDWGVAFPAGLGGREVARFRRRVLRLMGIDDARDGGGEGEVERG